MFRSSLLIMGTVVLLTLVACSEGARQADIGRKPNVEPITTINPQQSYIAVQRNITFSCKDPNAGDRCASTYYTVDQTQNSDFLAYLSTSGVNFSKQYNQSNNTEKVIVRYYSVDTLGLQEKINTKEYILETQPPIITVDPKPTTNTTFANTQWVSINCIDPDLTMQGEPGSGCALVYYALVDINSPGPYQYTIEPYDSKFSVQINEDKRLVVFAEDAAGNRGVPKKLDYKFSTSIGNVTNLTATVSSNTVTLDWRNPQDPDNLGNPDPSLAGVIVIRKKDSQPLDKTDGQQVGADLTNGETTLVDNIQLNAGDIYYYGVFTYDNAVTGGNFSTGFYVSVSLTNNTVLSDVSVFSATKTNNAVTLSWTSPIEPEYDHVVITRGVSNTLINPTDGTLIYDGSNINPPVFQYIDSPLASDVTYYYKIYSYYTSGQYSSGVGLIVRTLPQDPPPGNIKSFGANVGDNNVVLNWQNPADLDLASVHVIRKLGAVPATISDGVAVADCSSAPSTTTCNDMSVVNGQVYFYGVYVKDQAGQLSNMATIGPLSPIDTIPPGAVSAVSVAPGSNQILLSWVNPNDADFSGVTIFRSEVGFQGYPSSDPNVVRLPTAGVSLLDVTVLNTVVYYYSIFAFDTSGNYESVGVQITATPQVDATQPMINLVIPANAAAGVNPNLPVSVQFSEAMAAASITGAFTLNKQNGALIEGTATLSTSSPDTAIFTATTGLPLATQMVAQLDATLIKDLSGNLLNPSPQPTPYRWSFTSADGNWDANAATVSDIVTTWTMDPEIAIDKAGNALAIWAQNPTAGRGGILEIVAKYYDNSTGWDTQTTQVSAVGISTTLVKIAMDNLGNAIAVFFQGSANRQIYAVRYLKGNGWGSSPVLLQNSITDCIDYYSDPALDVDANGVVTVAWAQKPCGTSSSTFYDIWASRFALTTTNWPPSLSSAEMIEWNDMGDAQEPQLSVDQNGNALVIWRLKDNVTGVRNVYYNRFDNNAASWDQSATVPGAVHPAISNSTYINEIFEPKLAVDKSTGNAIAIWCHRNVPADPLITSVNVIWGSIYNTLNLTWSAPQALSAEVTNTALAPTCGSAMKEIAMHDDGSAIAIWPTATSYEAHANYYDPITGSWVKDINFSINLMRDGDIAFDDNGNALILMQGNSGTITAHRYIKGTAWNAAAIKSVGSEVTLDNPNSGVVAPLPNLRIAVNPNGIGMAIWSKRISNTTYTDPIIPPYDTSMQASRFDFKSVP